jgi:thiamine biosynthesis lipoprotein
VGDDHAVRVGAGALCTSSRRVRRWCTPAGEAHHIIDPATQRPAGGEIEEAAVVAADAATADALATALVAQPVRGLAAVERLGAAALLRLPGRGWWMTPRMADYLT